MKLVLDLAGVDAREAKRSAALDLALLSVPDVEVAATRISTWLTTRDVSEPLGRPTDPATDRLLGALRAYFADRHAEYSADCWTVANAIVEMASSGIDVLNLSLVCYTRDGLPPLLLSTAVSRLGRDVVVVAAAGNHGDLDHRRPAVSGPAQTAPPDAEPHPADAVQQRVAQADPVPTDESARSKPTFPAALDGVVAVGAADKLGEPASFTPVNKYWIDLLAPGVDVLGPYLSGKVILDNRDRTAKKFDGLARWSGSSFAAALISGAIAAGVQPGRVTARQALENIRGSVGTDRGIDDPDLYVPPPPVRAARAVESPATLTDRAPGEVVNRDSTHR